MPSCKNTEEKVQDHKYNTISRQITNSPDPTYRLVRYVVCNGSQQQHLVTYLQ